MVSMLAVVTFLHLVEGSRTFGSGTSFFGSALYFWIKRETVFLPIPDDNGENDLTGDSLKLENDLTGDSLKLSND